MTKLLIAMTMIMAALIGPSVALNPQYEIPLSTCDGEGFGDGLLFGSYTYDAGYRVWEAFIEADGLPFYLSETGMIQYLGARSWTAHTSSSQPCRTHIGWKETGMVAGPAKLICGPATAPTGRM